MKIYSAAVLVTFATISVIVPASALCTYGDSRLVGGSGPHEGNVQVCINGTWGYVCDTYWSLNDAKVVCRQLGYSDASAYVNNKFNSYFGHGNGIVYLDRLQCTRSRPKLTDCTHGAITCNPYEDIAGVICSSGGNCTNGDIRLTHGRYYSYGRSEGRVEVCTNNQWGTVCASGNSTWTNSTIEVICRQLGYDGNYFYEFPSYISFGSTNNSIAIKDVQCLGSESSLLSCPKTVGGSGCTHDQDLGVRCFSYDDSSCTNGAIRLWSAYDSTPPNEGILQICRSGEWYAVCDRFSSSSCYIGKIACQSLGYGGAIALENNAGLNYGYYYNNDNYRYYCYPWHSSLSQCSNYYSSYSCGGYQDALGVVCSNDNNTVSHSECSDGDVRLVNGESKNEGRVEYCYKGAWSPMCSLSTNTARLVCKKLGYKNYKRVSIDRYETFGTSNTRSSFNSLNCYSSSTSLSQCSVSTKYSSGCYVSSVGSTCYTEYGLTCIEKVETCNSGDVRLVDGQIEQEGRAEVCVDDVWGTICDSSWNRIDAYVFCKTLGYDGPAPDLYYNGYYGQSRNTFPVWSYVNCRGWEDNITDCSKSFYATCSANNVAGVRCKEKCQNGDVRLSGGDYANEGTVEVCYNSLWGQISDNTWTDADARVVCRRLGYPNKNAVAVGDSKYGMSNTSIHLQSVRCTGREFSLNECPKTINSLYTGIRRIGSTEVAGVDCVYDEPTPPPCISTPPEGSTLSSCTTEGSIRLMSDDGTVSTSEGRVEYCNGQYWTPLCTMDNRVAAVACRQLGHTQYQWASVLTTGGYANYSLVHNITCSGTESSIDDCSTIEAPDNCLPWCPNSNIGLRCFENSEDCIEGTVRLADGIIEQEGRVEVCVNGVWGSICDDGWDKTDAHVVCRQMGHPVAEPYIFTDSNFGDGRYPIVFSNTRCGGWENRIQQCDHNNYIQTTCSREHTAGVLCGSNCTDGDVRLVDGPNNHEGTVEVCFNSLWGLIEESGWSKSDAKVVCSQLGYIDQQDFDDVIHRGGSYYGKSNLTVHLSNVECLGDEENIKDCTQTTYSLAEGKNKLQSVNVASVRCTVPDRCVTPPTGGTECTNHAVRLTGDKMASAAEGTLEYCHNGYWSPVCSLSQREATVACRQLGYPQTEFVSIFDDGRHTTERQSQYTSNIENITCTNDRVGELSQCRILDGCQSTCSKPIGIKCFEPSTCEEGLIRLVDGHTDNEGRIEICRNNVWGVVCGKDFDFSEGFVACRSFFGAASEPTVFTNSFFGDGQQPIVMSNVKCEGQEDTLLNCGRSNYGDFQCSRGNIAAVRCKDECEDGRIRLVGGRRETEGTIEVCYNNVWGLIVSRDWNRNEAAVACHQLGYQREGAVHVIDSRYGKPNSTFVVSTVGCSGWENTLDDCDVELLQGDEGHSIYEYVNASGVSCRPDTYQPEDSTTAILPRPTSSGNKQENNSRAMSIAMGFVVTMLVIAIAIILGMVVVMCIRSRMSKADLSIRAVNMSSVSNTADELDKGILSESPSFDEKIIPL